MIISKWISHMCTCIPSFLDLSLPPGHYRAPSWAPCAGQQVPTSYLFYRWWCVYVGPTLSIHPALLFPHHACVSMSILYVCISIPALEIASSVPFFYVPHIGINMWYLLFSLWLTYSVRQTLGPPTFLQMTKEGPFQIMLAVLRVSTDTPQT